MTIKPRGVNRRQFLAVSVLAGASPPLRSGAALGRLAPAADQSVYLSDLDRCRPSSALSRRWEHHTWRLLEYQAQSFRGTMLVAAEDSRAPEVIYPDPPSGWHEIYIGLVRKPFEEPKQVQVRLTDDPAFTTLTGRPGDKDHQENWADEIFWKVANLTGRGIALRQIVSPEIRHAWVPFIKLVPLSEKQIRVVQDDRTQSATRRLFVHTDAHFVNPTGSALELQNYIEPLRHTDVARIYWEGGGGDQLLYFSKLGQDFLDKYPQTGNYPEEVFYPRKIDRLWVESWKAYRRLGVDPLRVAAEFCQQASLEFHASYRVGGFVYPPPHDPRPGSSFYQQHPDLVCVARDGTRLPRISYAFPETRRFVVSLFREMASGYPIDGVCLLYNRRPPLLVYEAPLVEGYREKFGRDPRQMDPEDPSWLSYRGSFLTLFMRELREAMDRVSEEKKLDRRLQISAVVSRYQENRLHGMDLKAWIQEGLVDTIIPYSSSVRLNSYVPAWEDVSEIEPFVSLVRGTKCQLALNMMPRDLTTAEYRRMADRLYRAGVKNFFFWDGIGRVRRAGRLGHRDEVEAWIRAGEAPIRPTAVPLTRMGEWDLTVETPG